MATQTATQRQAIVAAFHTRAEAQRAVRDLKAAAFTEEQIGIASQNRQGVYQEQPTGGEAETEGTKAREGATTGAVVGLGAGGLWGLGIVAGVLPAIGPVIAGGALAAIIASAAGTAVAGGLIGALAGYGIPEEEAQYYQHELEQGRTIVTVKATGLEADRARHILDQSNAYDFDRRDTDFARDPNAMQRTDSEGRLVAREDVVDVPETRALTGEPPVHETPRPGETRPVSTPPTATRPATTQSATPLQPKESEADRASLHGDEGGAIGAHSRKRE